MAGVKKIVKEKNHFFHARQPHEGSFFKSLHRGALYLQLLAQVLNFYLRVLVSFSKNFFSEKSFLMVSSISGLMSLKIRQP